MDDSVPRDQDDSRLTTGEEQHPLAPGTALEPELAERPRRGRRLVLLSTAAAVLLAVGAGGGAIAATTWTNADRSTSGEGTGLGPTGGSGRWSGPRGVDPGGSTGSGTAATAATPATTAQSAGVVTIVSTLGYQSAKSAGTGIVLTATGRILTNNHVIDGATAIEVTVGSAGRSYAATVVGTDATRDIAVLQLRKASGLTTARIASTTPRVGQAVTAVGNAGGTGTLAAAGGTVTALKQAITTAAEDGSGSEDLTGLIETDADVVSGDSGGPLLSASGAVLGIDTAAGSGSREVTGYAITVGSALSIADRIVSGDTTGEITLGLPAFLGVSVAGSAADGVVLGSVLPGTPAAAGGLSAGDTVTAAGGRSVASPGELTGVLGRYSPGDRITLAFLDTDGSAHSVEVTLSAGPAD